MQMTEFVIADECLSCWADEFIRNPESPYGRICYLTLLLMYVGQSKNVGSQTLRHIGRWKLVDLYARLAANGRSWSTSGAEISELFRQLQHEYLLYLSSNISRDGVPENIRFPITQIIKNDY
jgi:hypothetical protein